MGASPQTPSPHFVRGKYYINCVFRKMWSNSRSREVAESIALKGSKSKGPSNKICWHGPRASSTSTRCGCLLGCPLVPIRWLRGSLVSDSIVYFVLSIRTLVLLYPTSYFSCLCIAQIVNIVLSVLTWCPITTCASVISDQHLLYRPLFYRYFSSPF